MKIPAWIFTEFKSESNYTNCGHPHPSLYISKLGRGVFESKKEEKKSSRVLDEAITSLSLSPSMEERLDGVLAFVNRYAETLDVFFPNLSNQEALRKPTLSAKMRSPLAAQPPGTGKTALGENLIAVLRRPREDAVQQEEVARRLLNASAWRGAYHIARSMIDNAVADARDDNLVMRTLRVCFPNHVETLERLRASTPIVVPMKSLPRQTLNTPNNNFDDALGFLIFSAATGTKSRCRYHEYTNTDDRNGGSDGTVEALIRDRGPLLLVFDDITDLALKQFESYFGSTKPTPLHNAMTELSICLQRLHSIKGCFILCTGRSLWLSAQALVGSTSTLLLVTPLILAPLSAGDVLETLRLTRGSNNRSLEHEVGVDQAMLPYFAEQAVRVTGGIGRLLQNLLRALQHEASGRPSAAVHADVDAVLEQVRGRLSEVFGLVLRITWDGPAAAVGDVSPWLQQEAPQRKLLRLFARALLLDTLFVTSLDITLGTDAHVKFSDAAVVLGLSYAPVTALPLPPRAGTGGGGDGISTARAAAVSPPTLLKLVAGDWLCRSLLTDPRVAADSALLSTSILLDAMRTFGGTMRGRPFELLCIDALCARSLLCPNVPLRELVAHLGVTSLRDVPVPRLTIVAMPKVTRSTSVLDVSARASIQLEQSRWPGGHPTLHPDDLPWLLTAWLRSGTVAVPFDAQGGAQDWFVRLGDSILGIANKAVGPTNGTAWKDIREELDKAPQLPAPFRYVLVLWSLNFASQLREAIGTAEASVFKSGPWFLRDGRLTQDMPLPAVKAEKAMFSVPESVELVVVNPHTPSSGGLADLLGLRVLNSLHSIAAGSSTEPLGMPSLLSWI